jgi:mannan endo-1,4-beta-mannosidase
VRHDACRAPEKGDFVSVKGTHFVRHGKPYCISGANFWYGGYLGAAGVVGNRARLVKELDSLKAIGVNNVRVLAVSEQTAMASAVRSATTIAPGQYDENLLAGLDFLIAELGRRDMTAVLYLNNFWQWSGGMTQYLNWFEGTPARDPNATGDFEAFMAGTARFYVSEAAQAEYRRVIEKIVGRVNTVTGVPYRDDPTIMAWQLPTYLDRAAARPAMRRRPSTSSGSTPPQRSFTTFTGNTWSAAAAKGWPARPKTASCTLPRMLRRIRSEPGRRVVQHQRDDNYT